jgi:hypothetical protein
LNIGSGGGIFSCSATSIRTCSVNRVSVSTGMREGGTLLIRICSALYAVNCPMA